MKYGLFTDIPQDEYRKIDALANSDALMIEKNPSDYVWSKNAPTNFAKVQTKDIGTALHALLLEPETYDDLVIVSSVKGRQTKTFEQEVIDNPNNIVLTQEEAEQVRIMAGSVMAHPTASKLLLAGGETECSVIVKDKDSGVNLKCRPDKNTFEKTGYTLDVKTTDDLSKWRSDKEWINPLYVFDYGHNASFYTDIMEQHYKKDAKGYVFLCVQTKISLGKYPVGVFIITKDQMIERGFWSKHRANIDKFKSCKDQDNWIHFENFK